MKKPCNCGDRTYSNDAIKKANSLSEKIDSESPGTYICSKLGVCQTCIRIAITGMLGGWMAFFYVVTLKSSWYVPVFFIPFFFTLASLAHLLAFAYKGPTRRVVRK